MARSTADAGRCRGFVAGGGRGQGGGRGKGVVIEENMAATRELGNNKRTWQQQDQYGRGSFAKKKLSGGSVTKLSVSSVPKTVTKEDIQHAFEEHGQVEVALVKNKRTGQQQDIMGRTTTNISKGRGQGVDRSSGEQGRSQGSVLGSSDTVGLKSNQQHTLMSSPIEEGSDGDDVSSCRVASTKRGGSSQVQVPEPVNREWIYIIDGEFSNQITATRIIGVNLKGMWSGPWKSWKDVPNEDKKRLFERFHCYFQWEEKWNGEIYSCWEQCIAGKIPDLLCRAKRK
ncbi:uncharacterized protein LOC110941631 isoform X1 [Helianthus annuus]|uniref:uncharacterized protein LOC110941631 isoform X1 n=1 Tax=Helianthus annuus TaxID=4232 RepID=UPI000B8FDAB0|nr:uncharacterized protein LOC110941631 isoform X1 [Helianthus annuus]XP_035846206.1 uncharacterized protein LOC110941631 isoform X1 [Helianthus annuus]